MYICSFFAFMHVHTYAYTCIHTHNWRFLSVV